MKKKDLSKKFFSEVNLVLVKLKIPKKLFNIWLILLQHQKLLNVNQEAVVLNIR
jgi:hypothetical protein